MKQEQIFKTITNKELVLLLTGVFIGTSICLIVLCQLFSTSPGVYMELGTKMGWI